VKVVGKRVDPLFNGCGIAINGGIEGDVDLSGDHVDGHFLDPRADVGMMLRLKDESEGVLKLPSTVWLRNFVLHDVFCETGK